MTCVEVDGAGLRTGDVGYVVIVAEEYGCCCWQFSFIHDCSGGVMYFVTTVEGVTDYL